MLYTILDIFSSNDSETPTAVNQSLEYRHLKVVYKWNGVVIEVSWTGYYLRFLEVRYTVVWQLTHSKLN